ncbi:MAG: hypothetical protein RLZZ210_234 [Pseudomonadota bacterium]|jgi:phosphoribosylglycinamide formyltransferase-1
MKKIVILISGTGSNMQAIVNACNNSKLDAKVSAVISNSHKALGIEWANQNNISTNIINHKDFETRELFDEELLKCVQNYNPDIVVLAGFMRILTPVFIQPLLGKLINIHPSILPKFKGLHTHARAIEANEQFHGASVHFVTPELDDGPIILQFATPIFKNDTEQSLAKRVLSLEHSLYVEAINMLISEQITFENVSKSQM